MIAMCLYCLYLFDPCNDMLISINEPLKVFKSREKTKASPSNHCSDPQFQEIY